MSRELDDHKTFSTKLQGYEHEMDFRWEYNKYGDVVSAKVILVAKDFS